MTMTQTASPDTEQAVEPDRNDRWIHRYSGFDPEREGLREALLTLGNGYFATRGADETSAADGVHYPGTYLAGGYNRAGTEMAGRVIENEDLVNFPNWLPLTFRPEGGDWLRLGDVEILRYEQALDLRRGVLTREMRIRDADGRETTVVSRRIVHMENEHLAALEWTLTPENWSGGVEVRSALNGTVTNDGVPRYRKLESRHHRPLETGRAGDDGIYLLVETRQSALRVAASARTRVFRDGAPVESTRTLDESEGWVADHLSFEAEQGGAVTVEKVVAIFSSRDRGVAEPALEARGAVANCTDFAELLCRHELAWEHLWRRCDIVLENGSRTERILRLHIFHLLQTVSMNTIELDVGVPARGWHGEAYRGHIFWDELFIFPFLNLRIPELTRSLLRYRYRRLGEARRAAREEGFAGALYPWQSGSNGREETQQVHLNPKSGRWLPDHSHLQRHVNAAIAYNVWNFYETTGDIEFLAFYGGEMLLEIARFWASLATFNVDTGRYEIRGVMGPDEYHDAYPGAERPGLDNNAYTNVMAVWVLCRALEVLEVLGEDRGRELRENLDLEDAEIERWEQISRRMFVPFHDDGIISQFQGYEDLQEFDWQGYRERYGDIQRLDRILEAEGDTPNRYKLSKQADVLMLFYLFSAPKLERLFKRLGYRFEEETIPRNIDYYMQRTSHGSTLSRVVHSWVLARADRAHSWKLFTEALESDVSDVQGGTTPEGIHLGAMAGTVDLVQRGHTGLEMLDGVLWLNPCLPEELGRMKLRVRFRGLWLDLEADHHRLTVRAHQGAVTDTPVGFAGRVHRLEPGEEVSFPLDDGC